MGVVKVFMRKELWENVLVRHLSYGGLSSMSACSSLSQQRMSPEQTATAASLLSFEKQNKMGNMLKITAYGLIS